MILYLSLNIKRKRPTRVSLKSQIWTFTSRGWDEGSLWWGSHQFEWLGNITWEGRSTRDEPIINRNDSMSFVVDLPPSPPLAQPLHLSEILKPSMIHSFPSRWSQKKLKKEVIIPMLIWWGWFEATSVIIKFCPIVLHVMLFLLNMLQLGSHPLPIDVACCGVLL